MSGLSHKDLSSPWVPSVEISSSESEVGSMMDSKPLVVCTGDKAR